jgi:hypothetical protein
MSWCQYYRHVPHYNTQTRRSSDGAWLLSEATFDRFKTAGLATSNKNVSLGSISNSLADMQFELGLKNQGNSLLLVTRFKLFYGLGTHHAKSQTYETSGKLVTSLELWWQCGCLLVKHISFAYVLRAISSCYEVQCCTMLQWYYSSYAGRIIVMIVWVWPRWNFACY